MLDALTDLCDQVADSGDIGDIRSALSRSLGKEDAILRKAVPQLERILGVDVESSEILYSETFAFDRLKLSLRAFLRSEICTGTMIVMFIDDLHWCDTESWQLIRNLAEDPELSQLLLIEAYRATETEAVSPENVAVSPENVAAFSQTCKVQTIQLQDFNVAGVNNLIATVLRMSTDKTELLARIIHTNSAGNPHFTLQFMKAIEKQKLIKYSTEKFCWEWDLEKIQSDTDIADNIVNIYVAKINSLPADARTVLIIGLCLGAKFDALVFESLLTTIHPPDINEIMGGERLMNALELALKERIVDRQRGSVVYRFSHDKIHQAFYSLVSEIANADELHLRIGRALVVIWKARKQYQKPDQDWLTFLAANQLNLGAHLVPYSEESVEIAEVNLAAAKSAMNASAYRPTAEYLSRGLKIIEGWGWSHYDLCLELLTFQSRTEFCLGNFPECHKAVNRVLQNVHTAKEKIPVFQGVRGCIRRRG